LPQKYQSLASRHPTTTFRSGSVAGTLTTAMAKALTAALTLSLAAAPAWPQNLPAATSASTANRASAYDPALLKTYYNDIWSRIRKKWWVPEDLMFKQVKLHMVLEKDGRLSAVNVAASSGNSRADTLALIGVKRAAPFGPLPDGLPVPFNTFYTIGFKSNDNKAFVLFDGKRYDKGESYTLPTGTKVGHADHKTSDLDKKFHQTKEAALIKMNQLDDALTEENKAKEPTTKKANLLIQYAGCLIDIQEPADAKTKLTEALAILENNSAAQADLYPCVSQLAQLEYSIGELQGAEPLFKKAMAIKEKAPAPKADPEYKSLLEQYAKLLYKQNRTGEADEIYKKIRDMS
jgi:TonB family protein